MNTNSLLPYIGITDFGCAQDVERIERVHSAYVEGMVLMHVGIMMSRKTLHGEETKWSKVWPKPRDIFEKGIFTNSPTGMRFNVLHWADYDNDPGFEEDLRRALYEFADRFGECNGVQLDMIWPDAKPIAGIKDGFNKRIILQVGSDALKLIGDSPERLIERLRPYDGIADYVLLDKSMGKGIPMDAEVLMPFLDAVSEAFPKMMLAVAGGLGPQTLHRVEPILQRFPNVSIDAQGQLRHSGNSLDPIDWDRAEEYMRLAGAMYRSVRPF